MLRACNNDLGSYSKGKIGETRRHLVGPGKCLRIGTTPNDSAGAEDVPCSGGYTSHAR